MRWIDDKMAFINRTSHYKKFQDLEYDIRSYQKEIVDALEDAIESLEGVIWLVVLISCFRIESQSKGAAKFLKIKVLQPLVHTSKLPKYFLRVI